MTGMLSGQDERRALADDLADAIARYEADLQRIPKGNASQIRDLRVELGHHQAQAILVALRACPDFRLGDHAGGGADAEL